MWPILDTLPAAGLRLVCALCTFLFMANSGLAKPILRIATWDVSQAEKSIFARKKTQKKSSWRHTFGSERQDAKKSRLGVFNLDVDVVLLQGVHNVSALRGIFPTRHWKLILSRDYMNDIPPLSRLPMDLQGFDITAYEHRTDHPVTAIAVRYQRRLRVRAINHVKLDPSENPQGDSSETIPSATAVRINYFGSSLWLVSLAMAQTCTDAYAPCPRLKAIKKWHNERGHQRGIPAIVGTTRTTKKQDKAENIVATPSCGKLRPLSTQCGTDGCIGELKTLTRKKLGCIVLTTVHLPKPTRHEPTYTQPEL